MKRHLVFFRVLLILGGIAALAGLTFGAIPPLITYQGYLTTSGGHPVNGTLSLTFRIYDQPSAATALWMETHTVNLIRGVYSVPLGEGTPLALTFDRPYFLGIQVENDPEELAPRLPITSTGYAFQAQTADTNVGWVQGTNVVRLGTATDRVGMGIPTPAEELHVKGPWEMQALFESRDSFGGIRLIATNPATQAQQRYDLFAQPEGRFMLYDSTDARIALVSDTDGRVGIGTGVPKGKLDVAGEFRARSFLAFADGNGNPYPNNWIGMANNIFGSTPWLHLGGITDSGARRVALFADRVYLNGNVGVGNGMVNPTERLEINGNIRAAGPGNGFIYPDGFKQSTAATTANRRLPRPAFDSGWRSINPFQELTITHNTGGDVNNYVVDLQFKDSNGLGIHNKGLGTDRWQEYGMVATFCVEDLQQIGINYSGLTTTAVKISRGDYDQNAGQFRLRIWTYVN